MNHLSNFVIKTTAFSTYKFYFFFTYCNSSWSLANTRRSVWINLWIKHIILQCLKCIFTLRCNSVQMILCWYYVYITLDASQDNICSVSVKKQFFQLITLESHPGTQKLMYVCSCLLNWKWGQNLLLQLKPNEQFRWWCSRYNRI